ncbi:unnamed protein product [Cyclocybe aegerita]|uniref:Pentatricopeptide repeat-containing protein-mitochondrial domain-containing protein n=1 Tax=Cyclocybe aegerita TaxID=1973307 RepID=A0A8S0WNC0_CYCAE|nr:unnamed protein product [Cyclocybe aegerita]
MLFRGKSFNKQLSTEPTGSGFYTRRCEGETRAIHVAYASLINPLSLRLQTRNWFVEPPIFGHSPSCPCSRARTPTYRGCRPFISTQAALRSSPPEDIVPPPPQAKQHANLNATLTVGYPEFASVLTALATEPDPNEILRSIEESPSMLSAFSNHKKTNAITALLAQSSTPIRALQLLELAHATGHTLHHGAYEAVSFHLAASCHWDMVLATVATGFQHKGTGTLRLLNWRARALFETEQYAILQTILEEFEFLNIRPTQRTFHLVLSGCLRNHDMEGAKLCLRRMTEAGFPINDQTHGFIGRFYRQFGVDLHVRQNALNAIASLPPETGLVVLNQLVSSTLGNEDIPNTLQLLSLYDPSSIEEIRAHISTFATAAFDNLHWTLSDLSHPRVPTLGGQGLKADATTIALFMNFFIKRANYQGAIDLGNAALMSGTQATPGLVTSFVHSYFLLDHGNTAIRMIEGMCGERASAEFAVLKSKEDRGFNDPIPKISNVPLNARICNALLRGMIHRQGLRDVSAVFAIMHANGLVPNARTLEIILSCMCQTGVRPRSILRVIRQLSTDSLQLSVRHMHHIISYILREEKRVLFGTGWKSIAKKKSGCYHRRKPSATTSATDPFDPTAGIMVGTHTPYRSIAERIAESLASRSVRADPAVIGLRMKRDGVLHSDLDSAVSVLRTLTARGIHANVHHFSSLMEGHVMSGNLNEAKSVMKTAEKSGVIPNAVMYTILIHGYARQHNPRAAADTFRKMVKAGIRPDVASIDAVVSAFFAIRQYDKARRTLIALWPYVDAFPPDLHHADLRTLITRFRSLKPSRAKRHKVHRSVIYRQMRGLLDVYRRYFGPSQFHHEGRRQQDDA